MRISKRLLKRIAIGFALVIGLLLVINGILAWIAQHRLDQRIAEIRAAGDPALLPDLVSAPVPPDENAAAYLQKISPDLERFERDYWAFETTPLAQDFVALQGKVQPPNAEILKEMRRVTDAYPVIVPTIVSAASCPRYNSLQDFNKPAQEVVDDTLKIADALRALARFTAWKMAVLVTDGRTDEEIRLATKMLQVTRLYNRQSMLISYLVSCAVRRMTFASINVALHQGRVSPAVRAELAAELAKVENVGLVDTIKTERPFSISLLMDQTRPVFLRWPVLNWMLAEIDAENRALEVAELSWEKSGRRWNDAKRQSEWPQLKLSGSKLIGPAMNATFGAGLNVVTLARCLRVVNALGEYRDRTGKDAESIEQLSLPLEAFIDPCTGKPLRIRKAEAGWIVYSLYRNGQDDGGQYHREDGAWGFGPPGYENSAPK
jgi:hypothetical protein